MNTMPTPRCGDLAHQRDKPLDFAGRQRRGGLVENENLRCVGQRLDDRHHLPPPDREIADRRIDIERHAERRQPFARALAHRRAVEHARAGELPAQIEIGGDVEARHEVELLEHGGDPRRLRGTRIGEADGLAFQPHLAAVRRDDAGENVH